MHDKGFGTCAYSSSVVLLLFSIFAGISFLEFCFILSFYFVEFCSILSYIKNMYVLSVKRSELTIGSEARVDRENIANQPFITDWISNNRSIVYSNQW